MPHYKNETDDLAWLDSVDEEAQFLQPGFVRITEDEVDEIRNRPGAVQTYQELRAAEYPTIQDQLDMMYHDKLNGTSNWMDTVGAVKTKYPRVI